MIYLLDPDNPEAPFPPVEHAETEPDGLLAIGGDLSPPRLMNAYRHGLFPWYSPDQPILWWSPDPRTILEPSKLKISRSLRKSLKNRGYQVTFDRAFDQVIDACAMPRRTEDDTWITNEMNQAYNSLHRQGVAHSAETWWEGELVGGLYGVMIGRVFFGESMFSRAVDASKVALVRLCEHLQTADVPMIDCQVRTEHLISLGAVEIPRGVFIEKLDRLCHQVTPADQVWETS